MTKNGWITAAFVAAAVAAAAPAMAADSGSAFVGTAPAGELLVGEPQDTYGTAGVTVYTIPAINFTARASASAYGPGAGVDRFLTAGGFLDAAPMLPNGSQIERIELRFCDTSVTQAVTLNFGFCPTAGAGCGLAGTISSGTTTAPGCGNTSLILGTPLIVNNSTTPLLAEIDTGTTSATTFSAVKLYYRLRVSPAPATATFPVDVPTTHPQFRFVEALAAAGITGGCGAGTYCPDAAVTRGQMAVFLSVALGLHFPN
jgi:S-layer family protein